MANMKLTVVLEPQKEGGFTVYVPSLPGCISQGDTRKEALENIKEAIELYLEPDTNELLEYAGEKVQVAV
jgi:predicted RNase H-like HicB family nuclease